MTFCRLSLSRSVVHDTSGRYPPRSARGEIERVGCKDALPPAQDSGGNGRGREGALSPPARSSSYFCRLDGRQQFSFLPSLLRVRKRYEKGPSAPSPLVFRGGGGGAACEDYFPGKFSTAAAPLLCCSRPPPLPRSPSSVSQLPGAGGLVARWLRPTETESGAITFGPSSPPPLPRRRRQCLVTMDGSWSSVGR